MAFLYKFIVVVPPTIFSRVTSHSLSSIANGSTVDMLCEATSGYLPISYTWTDPIGRVLSPGDTDGRISFKLRVYGTYTCIATNDFGMDTSTVLINMPGDC